MSNLTTCEFQRHLGVGPDNRCPYCLKILLFDSEANISKLRVGDNCISQRSASAILPSTLRAWPYDGELERAWVSLNRDIKNSDVFWVRVAFADSTWKTIEQDWFELTRDEADRLFDRVIGFFNNLACVPCVNDLFEMGFGCG